MLNATKLWKSSLLPQKLYVDKLKLSILVQGLLANKTSLTATLQDKLKNSYTIIKNAFPDLITSTNNYRISIQELTSATYLANEVQIKFFQNQTKMANSTVQQAGIKLSNINMPGTAASRASGHYRGSSAGADYYTLGTAGYDEMRIADERALLIKKFVEAVKSKKWKNAIDIGYKLVSKFPDNDSTAQLYLAIIYQILGQMASLELIKLSTNLVPLSITQFKPTHEKNKKL